MLHAKTTQQTLQPQPIIPILPMDLLLVPQLWNVTAKTYQWHIVEYGKSKCYLLVVIDLNATFDTIYYQILLDVLLKPIWCWRQCFGLLWHLFMAKKIPSQCKWCQVIRKVSQVWSCTGKLCWSNPLHHIHQHSSVPGWPDVGLNLNRFANDHSVIKRFQLKQGRRVNLHQLLGVIPG